MVSPSHWATYPNCGKILKVLNTTLNWKLLRGTRLIAVSRGKKFRNWIIRSQATKSVLLGYVEGSETIWMWG